ncbi:MAG: hypothetical protein WCS74_02255, partial [Dehalococcoidales bacterium]
MLPFTQVFHCLYNNPQTGGSACSSHRTGNRSSLNNLSFGSARLYGKFCLENNTAGAFYPYRRALP